jgi:hypothetical protein
MVVERGTMSYLTPQEEQQGLRRAIKATVRLASTGNVNLGAIQTTMDGVALADRDRALLKNQTSQDQNGIYVWSSGTQLFTRARDFLSSAEVGSGLLVTVREGDTYQDSQWQLATEDPITVGTTLLVFERAAGKGAIITQLQLFVVGYDQVDGIALSKVSCQFAFNPSDWPPGKQFFFGAILSVNQALRTAAVELHNLTDVEQVTTGVLSTSSLTPVKTESSALTVGSGAGNLKSGERVYEVRITNDGTLDTEKSILGCAYMRIADG